jgi:DNA modification methylase
MVDVGTLTWTRGTGSETARRCLELVRRYAPASTTIVDPFCGEGMVLAVANALGFDAIGIERNRKRAEKARRLTLEDVEGGSS